MPGVDISERSFNKYKNGEIPVEKMSFGNAIVLTNLHGEVAENHLEEVLEMFFEDLPNSVKKKETMA
ncbi:hypothetical protein [Streptococcus iniae]|uniref:hypothetical protein n=1 Tax=Streptococcus iniae TaxID=1346 RepID=UPI000A66F093|nr:hypothetical protein [Streptococcus iniae]HEK4517274.1 hypothetical protein [Streptococcus iniae]